MADLERKPAPHPPVPVDSSPTITKPKPKVSFTTAVADKDQDRVKMGPPTESGAFTQMSAPNAFSEGVKAYGE